MTILNYSNHPSYQIFQLCKSVTKPLWFKVDFAYQENCIALNLSIQEEGV